MGHFSLIAAAVLGFFLTAAACHLLVRLSDRRETLPLPWLPLEGGCPTMGGVCLMYGTLCAVGIGCLVLLCTERTAETEEQLRPLLQGLVLTFAFGGIGFADDWLRLSRGGAEGLSAAVRVTLEFLAAGMGVLLFRLGGSLSGFCPLPFVGGAELGALAPVLEIALLTALAEGSRLSDTTDGLAACAAFGGCLVLLCALPVLGCVPPALLPAALAGGLPAFLLWGFAPARLRGGSTGSLFFAGVVGSVPLAAGWPHLLLLAGLPLLLQSGMVGLQLGYYRCSGGKRLFPTAPLDYLLCRRGWSTAQVCALFGGMGMLCVALNVWLLGYC